MWEEPIDLTMSMTDLIKKHKLKKRPTEDVGEVRHPFVVKKTRLKTIYIPLKAKVVSKVCVSHGPKGHSDDNGFITMPVDETVQGHVLVREMPDGYLYFQFSHAILKDSGIPLTGIQSVSKILSSAPLNMISSIDGHLLFITVEHLNQPGE